MAATKRPLSVSLDPRTIHSTSPTSMKLPICDDDTGSLTKNNNNSCSCSFSSSEGTLCHEFSTLSTMTFSPTSSLTPCSRHSTGGRSTSGTHNQRPRFNRKLSKRFKESVEPEPDLSTTTTQNQPLSIVNESHQFLEDHNDNNTPSKPSSSCESMISSPISSTTSAPIGVIFNTEEISGVKTTFTGSAVSNTGMSEYINPSVTTTTDQTPLPPPSNKASRRRLGQTQSVPTPKSSTASFATTTTTTQNKVAPTTADPPLPDSSQPETKQRIESEDEETKHRKDCFRQGVVDVPALVELLQLVGFCPLCKARLRCQKVDKSETNGVVTIVLQCPGLRSRCGFVKHWNSSPTTF